MKKYNVENKIGTPEMMNGSEPWSEIRYNCVNDYIEADTPEMAIKYAIDYLVDSIHENGFFAEADYDNEEIKVLNDEDEPVSLYWDFVAAEVEE